MSRENERFGSNIAYVMALAGSAIGLGNIWRFPYIMGEYGGSAFILIYILCSFLISLPILLCETVIGIEGQGNPYVSLKNLAPGTKWKYVGIFAIVGSFFFVSYYSVVGGWSVDFFARSLVGGLNTESLSESSGLFGKMVSSPVEAVAAYTVFLGLTAFIIIKGISKGIELFNKFTIPLLFVLIVFLVVYCLTLPGSSEGVRFLLYPDFSKITPRAVIAALGQSFYSLSVGIGMAITYSSYSSSQGKIVSTGVLTCVFDTMFSILAGFAVIPAVFAAGIEPSSGPSLVFSTLPYVFSRMSISAPVFGTVVTALFFVTVLMAALSSSISMFETVTSHIIERKGWSRTKSAIVVSAGAWCIGILCALSFGILNGVRFFGKSIFDFFDTFGSNYVMVAGAFCFCIFVGWVMKKETVCKHIGPVFHFLIKWILPGMVILIFLNNIL